MTEPAEESMNWDEFQESLSDPHLAMVSILAIVTFLNSIFPHAENTIAQLVDIIGDSIKEHGGEADHQTPTN